MSPNVPAELDAAGWRPYAELRDLSGAWRPDQSSGPHQCQPRRGGDWGQAVPLIDAAGARAADAAAVDDGDTWQRLMATAAGHLARGVAALAGRAYGVNVVIVAGKGNNGGDGWAAALRLAAMGAAVEVVAVDGLDVEMSSEANIVRTQWVARGGRASGPERLQAALADADVAVDALLGTGATGAPGEPAATAIGALAAARDRGTLIVACDLPTGVQADDGSVAGSVVTADATVTFGAVKRGLLLDPGRRHAGRILVGGLGSHWQVPAGAWQALTACGAKRAAWPSSADKWDRGRVLVIAGAAGTSGAAVLAAHGALLAGAGLVTLAVPIAIVGEAAGRADPAVMVRGFDWATPVSDLVDELEAADVDAVVVGPGLGHAAGQSAAVLSLVVELLARARRAVVDADGLNVLRDNPNVLAAHVGTLVVTPHRRELARIGGGATAAAAWRQRASRVPALATELDAVVVAKGPGTLTAGPDGRVWICPFADAALGSGGTGDVLAGVIGAAIATSDDVALAAARGVWQHAHAGMTADEPTATGLLRRLGTLSSGPRVAALCSRCGQDTR